jgi:hypothetical protein
VLRGGICKCLWLGDNDVKLFMVKQVYQNLNRRLNRSLSHTTQLPRY